MDFTLRDPDLAADAVKVKVQISVTHQGDICSPHSTCSLGGQ